MSRTRNKPNKRPKSLKSEPEPEPKTEPSKSKKLRSRPGSTNQNNPDELHANGSSNDERMWSKNDVVLIMRGMVDFIVQNGVDPMNNVDDFVDFINNYEINSLCCSVTWNDFSKISWNLGKIGSNKNDCVLQLEVRDGRNCSNDGKWKKKEKFNLGKNDVVISDFTEEKSNSRKNDGGVGCSSVKKCVGEEKLCLGKNDGVLSEKKSNSRKNDGEFSCFSVNNCVAEKKLSLGKNDGGVSLSKMNVVGENKSSLGKNDGGISLSKRNVVGKSKSSLGKNDFVLGGASMMNFVDEKKSVRGKYDGGVGCSSVSKRVKEKSSVGEKKVKSVVNVGVVNCVRVRKNKSSVGGEKSKLRKGNGEEKCIEKSSGVGVKKSKSRARGSRGRGRGRGKTTTIQDDKVDDGDSCSSIPSCGGEKKSGLGTYDVGICSSSAKEKISAGETKVNRVENVGGIYCAQASESMEKKSSVGGEKLKWEADNGGKKCIKTENNMKRKSSSVIVKRSRLGARMKRKPTILHVGKKAMPKAKEDGGMKQNRNNGTCGEHRNVEAKKGGMKNNNFGFWNENEVMVREAMRRMISTRVSLRDELQADVSWCPPKIGVLKWNTDASLRKDDGTAAIGGVLRDWHGSYRCVFSCPVNCLDSNEVELRAIYKALELASCKDWLLSLNMVIESDSMNAVNWCNEDNGGPMNLGYMLSFIRECMLWWPGLEITYMGRKSNSVADRLAKQGHQRTADFVAWM